MTPTTGPDLAATWFLDHDTPQVAEFVTRTVRPGSDLIEQAVALYYAVRDGIRYEIYGADLSRDGLRASQVVRAGVGLCMHKSVLYAACLRSIGVPSRLVLADVRNHLTSPRLKTTMNGDVFHFHCFTNMWLEDQWVRATPVFNSTLCRLFRIAPLDFDGRHDSVYHPFDLDGRRHMEILRVHGEFDDLPHERIITGLRSAHPGLFAWPTLPVGPLRFVEGSLARDGAES